MDPLTDPHADLDDTPSCGRCDAQIGIGEEAYVSFPGAWGWSHEHDMEIFILDPDVQLAIVELGNGQLALLPDRQLTKHMDAECFNDTLLENQEDDD